ncbi:MAG: hypothetical protein IJK43_07290 [Prevotella sp.]|nr:hypothetical protein [Prevotella sp.]
MDKDRKSEIHITNNFNAPIGQHIDHVGTINFRMDGEGSFHFGMVEEANAIAASEESGRREEEMFHFVHPELGDEEGWLIHDAVKRLVTHQKVQEICLYLKEMRTKRKVLLPQSPSVAYKELVRMGMPSGDGYSEKYFSGCYLR